VSRAGPWKCGLEQVCLLSRGHGARPGAGIFGIITTWSVSDLAFSGGGVACSHGLREWFQSLGALSRLPWANSSSGRERFTERRAASTCCGRGSGVAIALCRTADGVWVVPSGEASGPSLDQQPCTPPGPTARSPSSAKGAVRSEKAANGVLCMTPVGVVSRVLGGPCHHAELSGGCQGVVASPGGHIVDADRAKGVLMALPKPLDVAVGDQAASEWCS
jgi:hypothetical protein